MDWKNTETTHHTHTHPELSTQFIVLICILNPFAAPSPAVPLSQSMKQSIL